MPPPAPYAVILYTPDLGTVHICIPEATLKKSVLLTHGVLEYSDVLEYVDTHIERFGPDDPDAPQLVNL